MKKSKNDLECYSNSVDSSSINSSIIENYVSNGSNTQIVTFHKSSIIIYRMEMKNQIIHMNQKTEK